MSSVAASQFALVRGASCMINAVQPAPIALFVYKRPAHARATLTSLLANPEASRSRIVVFADGARRLEDAAAVEETRRIIREQRLPNLELVERENNLGLARSIIEGVTALCAEHGRVIVLEDDLVVAPTFLGYMNEALERYESEPSVYQVSGHMFPLNAGARTDAFFMPFVSSWGWATWRRAWKAFDADARGFERLARDSALRRKFDLGGAYPYFDMLARWRRGQVDSWAIRWNLSVFMQEGLVLYPAVSLVRNDGFDGSGSHCGNRNSIASERANAFRPVRFPNPAVDTDAFRRVRRFFLRMQSWRTRLLSMARRVLRR